MSLDQVVLMGHGRMLYMGPPADGERPASGWLQGCLCSCALWTLDCAGSLTHPCLAPAPAAEAWFERHGLPCPPGTAIAEHMLRIASDAASIKHLLLALAQEEEPQPGSPPRSMSAGRTSGPFAAAAPTAAHERQPSSSSDEGSKLGGAPSISNSPFDASPAAPLSAGLAPAPLSPAPGADVHARRTSHTTDTEASQDVAAAAAATAAAADQAGGVALRQARRRKAPVGRQLSVMFWRTFIDIGEWGC